MLTENFLAELVSYTDFLIGVAEKQETIGALGNLANEISCHYRALGLTWLLLFSEPNTFGQGLTQSAVTRKFFLRHTAEEGALLLLSARKASFMDPFLDAVAVNRPRLALDIADLSPNEWWEDYEYEDDYSYARFLFELARASRGEDDDRLVGALDQFESALEGNGDVRFRICKALFDRNETEFEEHFISLIGDFERGNDEIGHPDSDSVLAQNYTFEPNRAIFVEGLALLRFADWLGLKTQPEYKFCPGEARIEDFGRFVADSWPYVDAPPER